MTSAARRMTPAQYMEIEARSNMEFDMRRTAVAAALTDDEWAAAFGTPPSARRAEDYITSRVLDQMYREHFRTERPNT